MLFRSLIEEVRAFLDDITAHANGEFKAERLTFNFNVLNYSYQEATCTLSVKCEDDDATRLSRVASNKLAQMHGLGTRVVGRTFTIRGNTFTIKEVAKKKPAYLTKVYAVDSNNKEHIFEPERILTLLKK